METNACSIDHSFFVELAESLDRARHTVGARDGDTFFDRGLDARVSDPEIEAALVLALHRAGWSSYRSVATPGLDRPAGVSLYLRSTKPCAWAGCLQITNFVEQGLVTIHLFTWSYVWYLLQLEQLVLLDPPDEEESTQEELEPVWLPDVIDDDFGGESCVGSAELVLV